MDSRFFKGLAFYSRIFLGIVFVWASIGKITDMRGFAVLVEDYRLLPVFLVTPLAFVLPWLEIFCGMLLLSGRFLRPVSAVVGGLLLIFVGAILVSIVRGLDIDCGCFEIPFLGSGKVGWFPVFRNVILLGLSAVVFFSEALPEKGNGNKSPV
ncbi:MAG TPA: MauE/DoxX family redox-associated membrane protein [Elusimicrobiota bacterium]|nr:MauE/DoxX family redox-associated membrane protein [Elusimicrobiota bacterium]